MTSTKVREESEMTISRSKVPFKVVRFEGKHEGDRSNVKYTGAVSARRLRRMMCPVGGWVALRIYVTTILSSMLT